MNTKKILQKIAARVRRIKISDEFHKNKPLLWDGKNKIIKLALSCKGWTNERKLSLLFDLAKETERLEGEILEIGSAWGRSTVLLALATTKTIWSVDPHTGGLAYTQKGEVQNSYDEFVGNLERHNILSKVKILRNTTQEVISRNLMPAATKFSLVFIDGLHTAEGVKTDIEFAFDRLVNSGVMMFDDYFEPSVQDYASMIDKLLKEKKVVITRDIDARLIYFFKSGN